VAFKKRSGKRSSLGRFFFPLRRAAPGQQADAFKLNGSACVLKNDQIRCAPASK